MKQRSIQKAPARIQRQQAQKTLAGRRAERAANTGILPIVQTFRTANQQVPSPSEKESISIQDQLNKERIQEIHNKNVARILATGYFFFLLVGQNIAVFYIIIKALETTMIKDLQLIFATLIGATLTETYFITKVIINFVFSTTDYTTKS
jgi:hypothetical protein